MMKKSINNNKKSSKGTTYGFTLVELLAVIVILSVILVVGVPTLVSNIKDKKQVASRQVYELIKSAARNYEIDYDIRRRQSLPIEDLCERYILCPIIDPYTNEEITGYISIGTDEYKFLNLVKLDFILGEGATTTQVFNDSYMPYTTLNMIEPTREGYDFVGWNVVQGNSEIDGNVLTIGDTDTRVFALWENWPTLSFNLNGGSIDQSFSSQYKSGTNITLKTPTKEGYTFARWSVNKGEGNSVVSGNNFTMGSIDTILTANWTINTYTINYNLNGGTNAEGNPTSGKYGETVTVSNPTRTGYKFTGWTPTGASMSGTNLTIGASNVTLTANWTINTYTISYELGGGTNAEGNPTSGTYGSTVTINNPTRTGYKFNGWTVAGASMSGTNLTIGASNVTLTANWRLETAVQKIENLYATTPNTEGLITDDTADHNIRYVGASPKNYIKFNNEDWRIIGIFNVRTSSGNTEKLLKIVRNEQFSTEMSWDSSASGVDYGFGVNEWSKADLMKMLNTYYLGTSATCRYCSERAESTCSNDCSSSVTPIGGAYTSMIENVVWNTGAFKWNDNGVTVKTSYNAERGTTTGKICTSGTHCNDSVTRTTTWQGKVGLIYPSDYGYASTDTSCRVNIIDYSNQRCKNNNWLHSGSSYWTLSPSAYSSDAYFACFVNSRGYVYDGGACNNFGVRPAIYLKSNVSITGGDGSSGNAYQISMS